MSGQRERAPNYSSEEKMLLINIISEYKQIIECKKSDTISWKDKEAAWTEITNKFNSSSPNLIIRSKQSLQKYYENKKKEVRKSVANERLEQLKTGGGKPIHSKDDPTHDMLLDIINKKSVSGLDNIFDGDHHITQTSVVDLPESSQNSASIIIHDDPISNLNEVFQENNMPVPSTSCIVDWGNYKSTNLKTPLSKKLKNASASARSSENWMERRRPTQALHASHLSEQYSDLAAVKLELAILQKEAFIADSQKRQVREEIEFELKKKSLELDIEIKKAQLKNLL